MSADQTPELVISQLVCKPCDVRWRGIQPEPCWVCGQPAQPGWRATVPACNPTWETEIRPPYRAVEQGDVL
jgi:hypothetical protein